MKAKKAFTPLYPTFFELPHFDFEDYPEINDFINQAPAWRLNHWQWGKSFLEFTGKNKSEHTYDRFRNEIERFLLWSFLVKQKPIDEFRKNASNKPWIVLRSS